MKKVVYYSNIKDDVVESKNQDYELKDNYKWIHSNWFMIILSYIIYYLVLVISWIYCRIWLRVSIKNKGVLRSYKSYYLYANHTQVMGDVLDPFLISFPKRPYIICSTANLGIPVIGHILPLGGALPIPQKVRQMVDFKKSCQKIINRNPIVIYPEAHLWPWYTKIREFDKVSFHYPVEDNKPVFVATTTYQKSKIFKRPKIVIYVDGPFYSDEKLGKKDRQQKLRDDVYEVMVKRSKMSTEEYWVYKKKDD